MKKSSMPSRADDLNLNPTPHCLRETEREREMEGEREGHYFNLLYFYAPRMRMRMLTADITSRRCWAAVGL